MPSSPRTPTRRRKSSTRSSQGIDPALTAQSSQVNQHIPDHQSHSRKSSLYSVPSPSTPRPGTSHSRNGDFGFSSGFDNGLGSLADELAEVYSDEEDGEHEGRLLVDPFIGQAIAANGHQEVEKSRLGDGKALQVGISFSPMASDASMLQQSTGSKHRQKRSRHHRSIDGDSSDQEEADGLPSLLEARLATIEALAKEGTATSDNEAGAVIKRVAESLKDLGSQSGVESGTTRSVYFDQIFYIQTIVMLKLFSLAS